MTNTIQSDNTKTHADIQPSHQNKIEKWWKLAPASGWVWEFNIKIKSSKLNYNINVTDDVAVMTVLGQIPRRARDADIPSQNSAIPKK